MEALKTAAETQPRSCWRGKETERGGGGGMGGERAGEEEEERGGLWKKKRRKNIFIEKSALNSFWYLSLVFSFVVFVTIICNSNYGVNAIFFY